MPDVQDEVTWVLETIRENWPGDWPTEDGTDRLYRVNRDDPVILETGERTKSVELSRASALGVSEGSRSPDPVGTEYDHRVTTTLDCRLEGLADTEWGHIESATDAKQLALYAMHALQQERSYPTVDPDADEIGRVEYHTLFTDEPTNRSHEHKDYFRYDWTVRLVGYETLPES